MISDFHAFEQPFCPNTMLKSHHRRQHYGGFSFCLALKILVQKKVNQYLCGLYYSYKNPLLLPSFATFCCNFLVFNILYNSQNKKEERSLVYNNILEAIGHTPLIRLNNMTSPDDAQILVKYEGLNVGGSIKTRTAFNMLTEAQNKGLINAYTFIVEPTSGNQGIGIALVGAVKGYNVKIIMPDSVSEERRKLITQYGAEVILIHDDGDIGACIEECMNTAIRMSEENPNVFIPGQFTNPDNPAVHKKHTAVEIVGDFDGSIDGFCSGVGTGGTISGIGEVLKEKFPQITIWAVEPENAAILSGGSIGTHLQMGIGDGLIPDNLNTKIYDDVCIVTDEEALGTAKELASKEGIVCGISSGSNVAAAIKLAKKLGKGKTVVTVLPDTGERYFSTPLFE